MYDSCVGMVLKRVLKELEYAEGTGLMMAIKIIIIKTHFSFVSIF